MNCELRKVALYFGSFNPIHKGHIGLGEYLLEHADVDELWYVVSPQNPLKQKADLWDDLLRYRLACEATKHNPHLSVCDIEFHLPVPSYTVNTLRILSEKYKGYKFSLLIGADNYQIFDKWYCYDEILRNYKIYVYPREGVEVDRNKFPQMNWLDAPLYPISSTMIRERLKRGESIDDLVPFSVEVIEELINKKVD
jgi:nicotinate-nucleotide adenylyltransferase